MNLNTIFFIGPQGSGKGTQAKILAQRLGFYYWEMGAILREVAKEDSELGNEVKSMVDNGILLPDELLYKVVAVRLSVIEKNQGVIFDGIPRRLGQAKFLLDNLKIQGRQNFTSIFIDLPKEETLTRLLKRAEIEKRADDTKEKIEFRLEQYHKDTLPVIDFLRQETTFIEIDGRPSVEKITERIFQALDL